MVFTNTTLGYTNNEFLISFYVMYTNMADKPVVIWVWE